MFYSKNNDTKIELYTIISIFNYFNMHANILQYITRKEYDDLLIPSNKEINEIQNWINNITDENMKYIIKIQNTIHTEEYDIHLKLWYQSHYYKLHYFNRIKSIVNFYNNLKKKNIDKAITIINKRIVESMWNIKTPLGKHMFNYRLKKDKLDTYFK